MLFLNILNEKFKLFYDADQIGLKYPYPIGKRGIRQSIIFPNAFIHIYGSDRKCIVSCHHNMATSNDKMCCRQDISYTYVQTGETQLGRFPAQPTG